MRNFKFYYLFYNIVAYNTIIINYSITASIINCEKKNFSFNISKSVMRTKLIKIQFLMTTDVFKNLYTGPFKAYVIYFFILILECFLTFYFLSRTNLSDKSFSVTSVCTRINIL